MGTVTLGGKGFALLDFPTRTVRQDHFLVGVFRRTGLDRVSKISEEDPKEFLMRLHQKLLASGLACEVLSGFLIPVGIDNRTWRPSIAKEVQSHLEDLNTEEDRLKVNQLAFECMTGFFMQGLTSLLNSLKRLNPNEGNQIESPRIEDSLETKLEIGPH